ncbi:MAG: beta-propeller domain-containing protein [Clostridia bacterium]|nr:beta-propeller domain-containing protein [Clostridia bacterium]
MNKKERLLLAIGEADEKYIKEAESKVNAMSIIKVAAVLVVVIALSLYLFIPFAPVTSNLEAYEDSSYYPLIEGIDEYRLQFMQPKFKNNFQAGLNVLGNIISLFSFGFKGGDMAPSDDMPNMDMENSSGMMGNGSYVENTDNQVDGVIEGDLMKMTDKYIFRLTGGGIRVYSIEKENSAVISKFEIPTFKNEMGHHGQEMYLSEDCNTVTVLKQFFDHESNCYYVGLISIDVSDVQNISLKGMLQMQGDLNTSRMVDGKLLLVTNYTFNRGTVDYEDPTTFVPTIDSGNGAEPIEFENIIYPEKITNTGYSVVALVDTDNLGLLGANALLNFTNEVYVSENNVYISREYNESTEDADGRVTNSNKSDIAILDYSGETLVEKGIITVRGWTEDQYSFDELDGYLRVVTSTLDNSYIPYGQGGTLSQWQTIENVSLYIFDLATNSLAYKVEDFAIQGEEATAVRFDGDMCYVCTAVVVKFTDPVYFIDLSDYENIGSVDTGVIEGYSDHLINYGEGFLLGIGRVNWDYSKIEIYEQVDNSVVGTMEYKFIGEYSTDYKSYLVNRENNIFGFGVDYFYKEYEQGVGGRQYQCYVLLQFDENGLVSREIELHSGARAEYIRAAYVDGYLYITTQFDLIVEKIN